MIVLVKHVLVFRQAAGAIAHGVRVFTDDAWLGVWVFTKLIHQRRTGIHGGDDIHYLGIAIFFVMHQAGIVDGFGGVVHRVDVAAVAGLIAQRPHHDRRMVLLRVNVAHDAIDEYRFPGRIVGDAAQIAHVGKTMGFDVGFGHHEQPVNVAQFIKARVVRVMGSTYRVDIVLLHQDQIFFDTIHAYRTAFQMVVIMAVDAV
ncbi:hypothetical protein D3C75_970300 [compost metagenome]